MSKRIFLFGLCAIFWTLSFSAEAQLPTKIPRIGYLSNVSQFADSARYEAFRQGLRELGYVRGKNIVIEYRSGEGKSDRLPALSLWLRLCRARMSPPLLFSHRTQVLDLAVESRLPAIYTFPEFVEAVGS